MVKELTCQSDFAISAYNFYLKNVKSTNPFVLSLGANTVEMQLKSIIEQECGYIPDDLSNHYLPQLATYIQCMKIPHFNLPYNFTKQLPRLYSFYNNSRYYDKDHPRRAVFHEDDFVFVQHMVEESHELLLEYQKVHERNLEELEQDLD